jgi:hypothetical protein
MKKPKYPVYVISKGRADICLTARMFVEDKVPFKLVVEPQEFEDYAKYYPKEIIVTLPFSNLGLGSIPARNWVWQDAKASGAERHWIWDDNISRTSFYWESRRVAINANIAITEIEKFVDRYTNIAVAGMNYESFAFWKPTPYIRNCRVYSNLLIKNDIPFEWRGRYNEDTDLCLQVLSNNWATVLFNIYMIRKARTMTMKGGNTDQLYAGDGRLEMARSLERNWPYVVETKRKYQRPQHHVKKIWTQFDTPLIRRDDIDWSAIENEKLDLKLIQQAEIKSAHLAKVVENYKNNAK